MSATYKRIIEERLSHEMFSNDYLVKDSPTEGTSRILISEFIDLVLADSPTEEDLAKILNDLAPEFSTQYSYTSGNIVTYQEQLYEFTASKSAGNWDSSKVTQKSVSQLIADVKTRIDDEATARTTAINNEAYYRSMSDIVLSEDIAEPYNTTKSYVVGDIVSYNLYIYRCTGATTGTWDASKWEQVTVDELFDDLNFSAVAISYDNTSSGLEADDVQDAIDEVVADVDAVETALETKAEKNGVYDDLVAGNLLSDSYTADNAPYLYRQSPSASSVEQNIVGGTVAWNQQFSLNNLPSDSALYSSNTYTANGVTFTKNNDGSITIQTVSGGATADTSVKIGGNYTLPFIQNHIHFIGKCKGGSSSTYNFSYAGSRYINDSDKVFNKQASGFNMWLNVKSGAIITTPIKVYPQVVDLEQMFGTTIADAVYTMEQATAGSGIAWLKANGFLTKDYYPYNSGNLQSVKTSGRKIVGKNLLQNVRSTTTVNGITFTVNNDGGVFIAGGQTASEFTVFNLIANNLNYYNLTDFGLRYNTDYIINGCPSGGSSNTYRLVFRSGGSAGNKVDAGSGVSFNIASDGATLKWMPCIMVDANYTIPSSGLLFKPMIRLASVSDATFEPYTTHTYPTSPIDLRGLFKLSNGNLVADGDVYSADGSVTRRYDDVDLGSLTWTYEDSETPKRFRASLPTVPKLSGLVVCSKYLGTQKGAGALDDKELCISGTQAYPFLRIRDDSITDATVFKNAVNGQKLVYELATPTSESADAYTNPQLVGSTEEFIDTRDVPIPVGGERKYHTDLKKKIEDAGMVTLATPTNQVFAVGDVNLSQSVNNFDVIIFEVKYSNGAGSYIDFPPAIYPVEVLKTQTVQCYIAYTQVGYCDIKYVNDKKIQLLRNGGHYLGKVYGVKY